jgi:hypothetical protein
MEIKIYVDKKVSGKKPHVKGTVVLGDKVIEIDQDVEVVEVRK